METPITSPNESLETPGRPQGTKEDKGKNADDTDTVSGATMPEDGPMDGKACPVMSGQHATRRIEASRL